MCYRHLILPVEFRVFRPFVRLWRKSACLLQAGSGLKVHYLRSFPLPDFEIEMPPVVSHLSHSIIRIPTFCRSSFCLEVWTFLLEIDGRLRWNLRSSSFASQDMGQNDTVKVLRWVHVAKETPPKNSCQLAPWQWFVVSWGYFLPFYTKLFLGEGDMKSWSWKPPEPVGSSSTSPSMAP